MGKYEQLGVFLGRQTTERVPLSFSEIEAVLGFKLPRSKRYPAWWSNSPSNNPMTKVWLEAGYLTEQVDTEGERLVFRRAEPKPGPDVPLVARAGAFPGYGTMKGTVRVPVGVDLAEPADADWRKAFD